MNAWTKVEDKVKWSKLSEPKGIIKPIAEKAIFKFENDIKLGAPSVARSGVMTNAGEIVTSRVHEGDIIIKNGRTIRLVTKFAHELSDHVMSIGWPTMSLHGNLSDPKGTTSSVPSGASYKAHGGYIGSNSEGYIDINKQVNCRNLTSDVMDFAIAITYALQSHLHNTDFILSLIYIYEPTRQSELSYPVFCFLI